MNTRRGPRTSDRAGPRRPGPARGTPTTLLRSVDACRADLLANGIDVDRFNRRQLSRFVRRHLDYFGLMLGCDVGVRRVVALVEGARPAGRAGRAPRRGATAAAAPGGTPPPAGDA